MFFTPAFVKNAERNPIIGIIESIDLVRQRLDEIGNPHEWNDAEHKVLWEGAAFVEALLNVTALDIGTDIPEPSGTIVDDCSVLRDYLDLVYSEFKGRTVKMNANMYKSPYKTILKNSFAYEFSQGDFERIQILMDELRSQISDSDRLAEDHKHRLLKKLEKLQAEFHKRMSDLTRFYGLMGDAGELVGKLATDAKPMFDRIREILEVVWRTQARAAELPSNSSNPMLGSEPESE